MPKPSLVPHGIGGIEFCARENTSSQRHRLNNPQTLPIAVNRNRRISPKFGNVVLNRLDDDLFKRSLSEIPATTLRATPILLERTALCGHVRNWIG